MQRAIFHRRVDPRMVALLEPASLVTEQFKGLRTHLLRAKEKDGHNTFLVTSTLRGEGKTTIAANLAVSLAQGLKETVLLVDCDMRRPTLHKVLGVSQGPGLAEFLAQGRELPSLLVKTEVEKLTLLQAGSPVSNPSELLGSERMEEFIKEVKARYDNRFIILDSPPLLPITDTHLLVPRVDAVILVVLAARTQRESITQGLSALAGARLLGVVLNKVDELPGEYYQYYKHYYRAEGGG